MVRTEGESVAMGQAGSPAAQAFDRLRADVDFLASALGETLKELEGEWLFGLVERVRALTKRMRAEPGRTELRADQQSLRAELIGRMDGIESRMDGIESRMDGIESRMGRIESRLTELGDRVSRIEGMLHWHFGRNEEPPALAE